MEQDFFTTIEQNEADLTERMTLTGVGTGHVQTVERALSRLGYLAANIAATERRVNGIAADGERYADVRREEIDGVLSGFEAEVAENLGEARALLGGLRTTLEAEALPKRPEKVSDERILATKREIEALLETAEHIDLAAVQALFREAAAESDELAMHILTREMSWWYRRHNIDRAAVRALALHFAPDSPAKRALTLFRGEGSTEHVTLSVDLACRSAVERMQRRRQSVADLPRLKRA